MMDRPNKIVITMLLLTVGAFSFYKAASPGLAVASVAVSPFPNPSPTVIGLPITDAEFDGKKIERTVNEWKNLLTRDEFQILREAGTEPAYSGPLNKQKRKGAYHCAGCGLVVFRSDAKYDSGTGWPSFFRPAFKTNLVEKVDRSLPSEERVEVECARCHSHLGHVFDDGPRPTGLRYCINSLAMRFVEKK